MPIPNWPLGFVDQFTVGEGEIEIAYIIPDAETAEDTVEPRAMPVAPHSARTDGPVYIRLPDERQ